MGRQGQGKARARTRVGQGKVRARAKARKWDPIEYCFYCTLILFLVGLKMAGYGRNM